MEKMEVAKRTVSGVPLRIRRVSDKTHHRFIIFVSIFFIIIINFSLLVGFQRSRYVVDKFNCVNFTKESVLFFRKIGITSYQVIGDCKDSDLKHSWVGIDFFGHIIHYEPQIFLPFIPEWRYEKILVNHNTIK